jgi:hypothetical protein
MPTLRSLQLQGQGGDETTPWDELTAWLAHCSQLTSLRLPSNTTYTYPGRRPSLAVSRQLAGLRCLDVPAELLEQEAGAWLAHLTTLTRLGLDLLSHHMEEGRTAASHPERRSGAGEGQVQGVRRQVQEVLQAVQVWPASLQQVVVRVTGDNGKRARRVGWEYTHGVPAEGGFHVWVEQQEYTAVGWARPFCPLPHLPGVWELQGEVQVTQ